MVAIAPIPPNELARLEALYSYQIMDTAPDERFDLFTRMCTWLFQVPVAAINLVAADNTFFKSLVGFPPYKLARATSICAHAVAAGDAIMEIENLRNDERFADHPLAEKGLRFYAGALLCSPAGHPLGTLCIGDTSPRRLESQDRQKLLELARGVGSVMELHRNGLWLLQAATQDVLTGLCNRRLFMERVQSAVRGARRDGACVVLCLDLDGFKAVNDTFGHAAGDALLREVGSRLVASVRAGDTVARLGGDEFAILLRRASTPLRAERLSQRVLDAFSAPFSFEGASIGIRGSIGIAEHRFVGTDEDAAALLRCADSALYEAKRAGRGCYRVFRAGTDARLVFPA